MVFQMESVGVRYAAMNEHDKNIAASELYAFVKDYALLKLEDETKRYESLIHQASNMQTAFAFSTAALFMVAPIAIEDRGNMTLEYLLIVFSSISDLLMISLFFAALAQSRGKLKSFADVTIFEHFVEDNYDAFLSKAQQAKAIAEQIGEVQLSASEKNNKMARRIRISMGFFYAAMSLSVFWFIVSLIIMFY